MGALGDVPKVLWVLYSTGRPGTCPQGSLGAVKRQVPWEVSPGSPRCRTALGAPGGVPTVSRVPHCIGCPGRCPQGPLGAVERRVPRRCPPAPLTPWLPQERRSALRDPSSPRRRPGARVRLNPLVLLLDAALTGELDVVQQAVAEVGRGKGGSG